MRLIKSIPCEGAVTRLRTSTDRSAVISIHDKRCIRLWNAAELSLLAEFKMDHDVFFCALSPDHRTLAVTTFSIDLLLFDVPSGTLKAHLDTRHYGVEFLGESGLVAAIHPRQGLNNSPQDISIYDFSLQAIKTFPMPDVEVGWEMCSLQQQGLLFVNGIGVTIWNTENCELIREINCDTLKPGWDIWETCCFDVLPDGKVMAIGFARWGSTGSKLSPVICTTDPSTGLAINWVDRDSSFAEYPVSVSLSSDGSRLVATFYGIATTAVWDTQTATRVATFEKPGTQGAVFLDNHRVLVGAALPDPLTLWEI